MNLRVGSVVTEKVGDMEKIPGREEAELLGRI